MLKLKQDSKPKNDKLKKMWLIIACTLILLIPLGLTKSLISERDGYRYEAEEKIEKAWSGAQKINPPVIAVDDGKNQGQLAIKDYKVEAKMHTEIRKKGIFKVPVYTAEIVQSGHFSAKNELPEDIKRTLRLTATDPRGYIVTPMVKIGKSSEFVPFTKTTEELEIGGMKDIPFEIKYKLRGINTLKVVPSGLTTEVKINGNWKNPDFNGDFLPVKKSVDKNGFSAQWTIPDSAMTELRENPTCGVSLLLPVDNYSMAYKAVKYGFLFISLTFLSLFLFELLGSRPVHPVQYVMVGLVMCMFYLLLLSMSEFIGFGTAYFVSSVVIISIITIYTHDVLTKRQNTRFTFLLCGMLVFLYLFLYILLKLQDFSLIVGSFGTLLILTLAMYVTRNVEWYKQDEQDTSQ